MPEICNAKEDGNGIINFLLSIVFFQRVVPTTPKKFVVKIILKLVVFCDLKIQGKIILYNTILFLVFCLGFRSSFFLLCLFFFLDNSLIMSLKEALEFLHY